MVNAMRDVRRAPGIGDGSRYAVLLDTGHAGRVWLLKITHRPDARPNTPSRHPRAPDPEGSTRPDGKKPVMGFDFRTRELFSIDDACARIRPMRSLHSLRVRASQGKAPPILPGATFWNGWTKYPFSSNQNGNARPVWGHQTWRCVIGPGEAWNEFGWSNPSLTPFPPKHVGGRLSTKRRALNAKGARSFDFQNEGGPRSALLALIVITNTRTGPGPGRLPHRLLNISPPSDGGGTSYTAAYF